MLLQKLIKGLRPDSLMLVQESIRLIEKDKVKKCVEKGLKSIMIKA